MKDRAHRAPFWDNVLAEQNHLYAAVLVQAISMGSVTDNAYNRSKLTASYKCIFPSSGVTGKVSDKFISTNIAASSCCNNRRWPDEHHSEILIPGIRSYSNDRMCAWPLFEACDAVSAGVHVDRQGNAPINSLFAPAGYDIIAFGIGKRLRDGGLPVDEERPRKRPVWDDQRFTSAAVDASAASFLSQRGCCALPSTSFHQPTECANKYFCSVDNLTPCEAEQTQVQFMERVSFASGASTYSSYSTCFADESSVASFWPEATATSIRYAPSPAVEDSRSLEASTCSTDASWQYDTLGALVTQFVELWQQRLQICASEITSLTLHIWRRVESEALRQTCYSFKELVAFCFWVALKFFLYRPLIPRARKLRKVVGLPQVDLARGELAIMKWVDWSPLRGY